MRVSLRPIAYTIAFFCVKTSGAQNVGIGPIVPTEKLHIHGGTAQTTSIGFSSNALQRFTTANSFKIGLFASNANPDNRYGFLDLPAFTPFYMIQDGFARMHVNGIGNVGIGSDAIDPYMLLVNGPQLITPGSSPSAALYLVDTTSRPVNVGSGLSVSKRLNNQNNFFQFVLKGNRSQAYLEANFKNGTANQGVSTVVFDSLGRVGIGSYILDSSVNTRLHVFGSQTIQQGILYLHGHRNNYTQGSEIRFQYNSAADNYAGPYSGDSWYSIEHEDADNRSINRQDVFAIVENYIDSLNPLFNKRSVGFALNNRRQVGIGRYPDKALESEIKVDIAGKARINGGLRLTGIGEATGKILVTNASGDATWQNPSFISLDQVSASGQSRLEFRNQGVFVGSFGWSEASSRYFLYDGPTNTNPLLVKNGRIGIGNREPTTNALEVAGNASKSSAGDWIANSDERLKKHIAPLQNPLEKLLRLQGVTYKWNDTQTGTNRPSGTHMGFTAQNIQQVFPELVSRDAQGFLQTAYGTYDALYVEAIRQLVKRVEDLENQLKQLKNEKK